MNVRKFVGINEHLVEFVLEFYIDDYIISL